MFVKYISAFPPSHPVQGRHPLFLGRLRRRGQGLGRAHDLQVRLCWRTVRRRKGRTLRRPQDLLRQRTWEDDSSIRYRARQKRIFGTRHRCSGSRHGHWRARNVLDRGHVRQHDGLSGHECVRLHHGKADSSRWNSRVKPFIQRNNCESWRCYHYFLNTMLKMERSKMAISILSSI